MPAILHPLRVEAFSDSLVLLRQGYGPALGVVIGDSG